MMKKEEEKKLKDKIVKDIKKIQSKIYHGENSFEKSLRSTLISIGIIESSAVEIVYDDPDLLRLLLSTFEEQRINLFMKAINKARELIDEGNQQTIKLVLADKFIKNEVQEQKLEVSSDFQVIN